ncbi:pathway-specific nitrogen regulator [Ophiocordyceps camponoti-floridani]|uniref:Pathway-specific nitrogen regulator n=1 Tax=Ophiocordyceps camponoti-floridani TaxID=2030778 RepID=A0A8H4VEU8_9HYPO|nr:pathway-specific nitrogen regulator [Ophiocordyceps camponoti-floridani]
MDPQNEPESFIPPAQDDPPRGRDDGADSSSQHEADVFSEGHSSSPRSSLGSMSEAEQTKIEQTLSQRGIAQRARSPRISEPPASETDDDFVPTVRGTPRLPFRSPSSVQALQRMASPPPPPALGITARRVGVSPQYSPRRTPPRFKRATPPLVLLHVTLLPLAAWPWGSVLDRSRPDQLSDGTATLRDAWRQLRNRTGDTVSDRGVLLPHPQADYELLEERLLEALELPLRRRARILECGHYLGPSSGDLCDGMESEDGDEDGDIKGCGYDDQKEGQEDKLGTHWCRTCRSEIRYDSLGEGKVFRVKVYASNGLMRAGAWAACWKEMERVDVELEPIVDASLHDELVRLADEAALMTGALGEPDGGEKREGSEVVVDVDDDDGDDVESVRRHLVEIDPCTLSPRRLGTGSLSLTEECGTARGDAENPPPSPAPPHRLRPAVDGTASLPQLLLEALRVVIQDRKNVLISLLGVLVLVLAVAPRLHTSDHLPTTTKIQEPLAVDSVTLRDSFTESMSAVMPTLEISLEETLSAPTGEAVSSSLATEAADLKVVETVTETRIETVTETRFETKIQTEMEIKTQTETETVTASVSEASSESTSRAFIPDETTSPVSTHEASVSNETINPMSTEAASVPAEDISSSSTTDPPTLSPEPTSLPAQTNSLFPVEASEAPSAPELNQKSPSLLDFDPDADGLDLDFHDDL